jgi:hypothetical protein
MMFRRRLGVNILKGHDLFILISIRAHDKEDNVPVFSPAVTAQFMQCTYCGRNQSLLIPGNNIYINSEYLIVWYRTQTQRRGRVPACLAKNQNSQTLSFGTQCVHFREGQGINPS